MFRSRSAAWSFRFAVCLIGVALGGPAAAQAVPGSPYGEASGGGGVPGLPLAGGDYQRAVQCLTEAVYYEAASEPLAGQQAVAQVVINRIRHPAFPKSVCGVVFEGSSRSTGCQFTFTCDGSLARAPDAWRWQEARAVATEALGGHVAGTIGASTHYHASWMTPYWSSSMIQTARIGGHVFYQLPGSRGALADLAGAYSGVEPAPPRDAPLAVTRGGRGARRARSALLPPPPPVAPTPTTFSAWGLRIATITPSNHELLVRADGPPPAASPAATSLSTGLSQR